MFLTAITGLGQLIYLALLFSMRQQLGEITKGIYMAVLVFNIFNGVLSVLNFQPGFLGYIFVLLFYVYALKSVFPTTYIGSCFNSQ